MVTKSQQAVIALGGNIGDVLPYFRTARDALNALDGCHVAATSPVYRTPPIGPQDQDDYDNAVLLLHTHLPPLALLDALHAIEQSCHRERLVHWGARTLDLDMIDYAGQCYHDERLTLPHVEAHARAFVLLPLADLLPHWQHPRLQRGISTLLADCACAGIRLRCKDWC
ncbi:MAG: 2-amino-4-hydroxy-6-hydroxymethyldihydropteridine diphosphokinase [Mariprofundaceae bacterium]|nr:2-amino-4-hydroxy-6-hydroxymethyldihydropteridine diphosphokinase [Mariprofundaceae bacterium]